MSKWRRAKRDVDLSATTKDKCTASKLAALNGHNGIVKLLTKTETKKKTSGKKCRQRRKS